MGRVWLKRRMLSRQSSEESLCADLDVPSVDRANADVTEPLVVGVGGGTHK